MARTGTTASTGTTPAKGTPVKKAAVKKAAVQKAAPVKKAAVKKAPVKKAAVKKAPPRKAATKTSPAAAESATATGSASEGQAQGAPPAGAAVQAADASSRQWTTDELDAVRVALDAEVEQLTSEIATINGLVAELIQDSGDGAGDDQAESGSKAFEREHEQILANNARDVVEQSRRALQRIEDGTYGTCESCGRAIAKPRLQAFPRATLCVACKQREEQR